MDCSKVLVIALASCQGHHDPLMTIEPDAQPLLDSWAAAIGGRDHIAQHAITHVHGTFTTHGETGTFESWVSARGELRTHIQLGASFDTTTIFDGTQGWTLDRNGRVLPLVTNELEAGVRDAALGSYAPLFPDRAHGTIKRDHDALVLSVGKHPLTITFDPQTHRPATYRSRSNLTDEVIHLDDWRDIEGVQIPFHTTTGGWTITEVTLDRADHESTAFTQPAAHEPPMHAALPITLPLAVGKKGWGSVQVSINGSRPLTFIVDTGAATTTLDNALVTELGLVPTSTVSSEGAGAIVDSSTITNVRLAIGTLTIENQSIDAVDLSHVHIDGLLGGDVLSRFICEFDYAKGTLRLLDRPPEATATPIAIEEGLPMIDATVELSATFQLPGHFLLDTGCACAFDASTSFTDANHILAKIPTSKPLDGVAAGSAANPMVFAKIHAIDIAGHQLLTPVAAFDRLNQGAMASPDFDGMIGAQLGRDLVITIDYHGGRIWLR